MHHGLGQDGDEDVLPGERVEESCDGVAAAGEQTQLLSDEDDPALQQDGREQLQGQLDAEATEELREADVLQSSRVLRPVQADLTHHPLFRLGDHGLD